MNTVGIIGAGVSGLACAKAAIESGLSPTVFEKASEIGGTWRPGDGLVWDGLRANLSHRSMSYSDFPWPFDTPPNPSAHEVQAYLTAYAKRFDLLRCIRLNCAVQSVKRSADKWRICCGDANETVEFDFVLVASGFFTVPSYPRITGLRDSETNEPHPWVTHSSAFRSPDEFAGQTVVVLGNAYSGADITVALAKSGAKKVISVANKPIWFANRLIPNDAGKLLPVDAFFVRSSTKMPFRKKLQLQHEVYRRWNGGDPGRFAKPLEIGNTAGTAPWLSITDGYLEDVRDGRVELKMGGVARFVGKTATFADGTTAEFDRVICAAGYNLALPFLDDSMKKLLDFIPHDRLQSMLTHKITFHPDLPNFAFVGMYRGPYFALLELQARWACMVFSGECPHPTAEEMAAGIQDELEIRQAIPRPQFAHIGYDLAEDISKIMGVFPQEDLDGKSGPMLAKWLKEGPLMAAHYRLCGPHANREIALGMIRKFNEGVEE